MMATPPTTSSNPPIPIWDISGGVPPPGIPPNQPKIFSGQLERTAIPRQQEQEVGHLDSFVQVHRLFPSCGVMVKSLIQLQELRFTLQATRSRTFIHGILVDP